MSQWRKVSVDSESRLNVFCNTRYLKISRDSSKVRINWIGERRSADGSSTGASPSRGQNEFFDHVILATGFGIETGEPSYWRNDEFAQTSLKPRNTYIVSGGGDGGVIDLLRLQISQFRQDRILNELFDDSLDVLSELRKLQNQNPKPDYFMEFEHIASSFPKEDLEVVCDVIQTLSSIIAKNIFQVSWDRKHACRSKIEFFYIFCIVAVLLRQIVEL